MSLISEHDERFPLPPELNRADGLLHEASIRVASHLALLGRRHPRESQELAEAILLSQQARNEIEQSRIIQIMRADDARAAAAST